LPGFGSWRQACDTCNISPSGAFPCVQVPGFTAVPQNAIAGVPYNRVAAG